MGIYLNQCEHCRLRYFFVTNSMELAACANNITLNQLATAVVLYFAEAGSEGSAQNSLSCMYLVSLSEKVNSHTITNNNEQILILKL